MKITLCVLLYGDHADLAKRCLDSINLSLAVSRGIVSDVRIGMNEIGDDTRTLVGLFVDRIANRGGVKVTTYDCPKNAFKYPMIRKMLLDDKNPPSEIAMWFDDDSYFEIKYMSSGWWEAFLSYFSTFSNPMLGKVYWQCMYPEQWGWIQKQAWFNPEVGMPPPPPAKIRLPKTRPTFKFCTGGWWATKTEILKKWDWPTKELKLIGGDSMLGELFRHQKYDLVNYEHGVRINANWEGKHSSAPGRGETPEVRYRAKVMLGNSPPPTEDLHSFECIQKEY